jgi:hypothetical protein
MNHQDQAVNDKGRGNSEAGDGVDGSGFGHDGHEIHFFVDGEREETRQREWTPNQIIKEFGKKDPATNYLVKIHGNVSYQGHGDETIKIHNNEKFQIVSTGPTTVSDSPPRRALTLFMQGLEDLGYVPILVPGHADHVTIQYQVPSGKFAGKKLQLGFIVPGDFPLTPPSGPHISEAIHPIQAGGTHPTGGIHDAPTFKSANNQGWQYWSRPHSNWVKKTVVEYMAHIRRLWETQ